MTRDRENIAQQMRQIESLFSPNNNNNNNNNNNYNNNKTKVNVEVSRDYKCDVHGGSRRLSNSSTNNGLTNRKDSLNLTNTNYFNNNNIKQKGSVNDKRIYDDIKREKNGIGIRRESMPSLNTHTSYYNRIYEPNIQHKEMEHPSDFPSILRKSSLTMSQNYLRTSKNNVGLTRSRENFNSSIFDNQQQQNNKKYDDKKLNKRNSFCGDLRHENLGSSLFLRRDSSGNTNLIRRDSIGSSYSRRGSIQNLKEQQQHQNSHNHQHQTTNVIKRSGSRDYVRTPNDLTITTTKPHEITSILRKTTITSPTINDDCVDGNDLHTFKNKENIDGITTNNNNNNLLTKENLKKHVTLLESKYDKLGQRRRSSIESVGSTGTLRRHSIDSLEQRRNSLDLRESESSSTYEKILPTIDPNRPKFVAVTSLEDVQAVRCAEFHPNGKVYAVGSNSKTFRICEYPSLSEIREEHTTYQPTVLFKRTRHHKGSIYCMAWSPQGDLVATGSNDKTVKLMRYNDDQKQLEGREIELTMHDGTVRDLCFIEDSSNQSSLLISGGAGDCKIYVTDCATSTPFQALSGHGGHVLSLYNWGGAMFVSGSQDKTVRFWDLRTRGCVNMVTPATVPGSRQGSPVASLCVDPSGRLLVSGHEDSSCVLYDIRGNRPIQCFKPHSSDIRSIRFSPSAYYLLTGGYDNKLVLTDLQGDLTLPLPSVVVAQHTDKIISGRWHPTDFSFISTSADKTATLWALPPI